MEHAAPAASFEVHTPAKYKIFMDLANLTEYFGVGGDCKTPKLSRLLDCGWSYALKPKREHELRGLVQMRKGQLKLWLEAQAQERGLQSEFEMEAFCASLPEDDCFREVHACIKALEQNGF